MIPLAWDPYGGLSYWVREWRTIANMSALTNSSARRPTPAADPLDSLDWREVDGELRPVER